MKQKKIFAQIMVESKMLLPLLFFTIFSMAMIMVTTLMVSDALSFEGRRGADPERRLTHLKEALNLSDKQVEQIRPILESYMEKRRKFYFEASMDGDRRVMREKMMVIREETKRQLGSILSPEQLEQFEQLNQKGMRGGKKWMRTGQ